MFGYPPLMSNKPDTLSPAELQRLCRAELPARLAERLDLSTAQVHSGQRAAAPVRRHIELFDLAFEVEVDSLLAPDTCETAEVRQVYLCEVKQFSRLSRRLIDRLLEQQSILARRPEHQVTLSNGMVLQPVFVLVTEFMPARSAQACEDVGLSWMDLSGRGSIALPTPVPKSTTAKEYVGTADNYAFMRPARVTTKVQRRNMVVGRVLVALSKHSQLTQAALGRELSALGSGMSPSSVSRALADLASAGFISTSKGKPIHIIDKPGLELFSSGSSEVVDRVWTKWPVTLRDGLFEAREHLQQAERELRSIAATSVERNSGLHPILHALAKTNRNLQQLLDDGNDQRLVDDYSRRAANQPSLELRVRELEETIRRLAALGKTGPPHSSGKE